MMPEQQAETMERTIVAELDGKRRETRVTRRHLLAAASLLSTSMLVRSSSAIAVVSGVDEINVKDLGAIGDGREHKVREWIANGRFASLRAIQATYPDVMTLDDLIDHAALNLAVRRAAVLRRPVRIPAGTYRAYLTISSSHIRIVGEGSDRTTIKLPDRASHSVPIEKGELRSTGVPCVIDFNVIGLGNSSLPLDDAQISGLTVDGNRANTSVPSTDLHGWGISFTRYSNVTYHDIRAINCHLGGIGTFIDSNHHVGEAVVENCGFSQVEGDGRPGFDINSSSHGNWKVKITDCWHGARMIDNCRDNHFEARILNAVKIGMTAGNQPVNSSQDNMIIVDVDGGCGTAGLQVGRHFHSSKFIVRTKNVQGPGVQTAIHDAAIPGRGCFFDVSTQRSGGQSVLIEGSRDQFVIDSKEDGRRGEQGTSFAVDISGSYNIVSIKIQDSLPWQVRGVALRKNAVHNQITEYSWLNTADPLLVTNPMNRLPRKRP